MINSLTVCLAVSCISGIYRPWKSHVKVPVNETPETHWDAMERNLRGPFEVTLKENGCIIFVSALEGHLIVTSKHAVGSDTVNGSLTHAQKGEEWLLKHLKDAGRSRLDLAKHLESHNVTAVFEVFLCLFLKPRLINSNKLLKACGRRLRGTHSQLSTGEERTATSWSESEHD